MMAWLNWRDRNGREAEPRKRTERAAQSDEGQVPRLQCPTRANSARSAPPTLESPPSPPPPPRPAVACSPLHSGYLIRLCICARRTVGSIKRAVLSRNTRSANAYARERERGEEVRLDRCLRVRGSIQAMNRLQPHAVLLDVNV